MVKRSYRSETPIANFRRQARENWIRSSDKESKGIGRRWRRKRYLLSVERKRPVFEGRPVQFPAWECDRAQKPTPKAATASEPSTTRGRSVSRKRSIHGSILRQPCRYYLKGTCMRSPCEYWHRPECQFYPAETGCKARDKCLFLHHKVDEQPNKKPKNSYHFHKGRLSDDKHAVVIVRILPQLGCVSQDSETLDSQRGKQSRRNPMQKSLETNSKSTVHSVYATSSKYPGETKDHRLEKYKSNFLISEVPTLWNLRTDLNKTLQDNSDAPKAWHRTSLKSRSPSCLRQSWKLQGTCGKWSTVFTDWIPKSSHTSHPGLVGR